VVELVKDCEIEVPDPAAAPATPGVELAIQLNVVPEVVLLNVTAVAAPEQIVEAAGEATTTGEGLTVIITGTEDPGQELAVGTTLYVTVPEVAPLAVKP
jgi:hypothetical protein